MRGGAAITLGLVLHSWVIASLPRAQAGVPPLTADQKELLATADVSRDFQEPAFFALIENTKQWVDPPGDAPVRLRFDEDAIGAAEETFRGELYRLEGRIEQIEWFSEPYDGVIVWFLRDASDTPRLVFIDKRPGFADIPKGGHAVVYARFYKFIEKTAADGVARKYAAFVGALPAAQSAVPTGAGPYPIGAIVMLVLVIGIVFLVVRRAAQHSARAGRALGERSHGFDPVETDDAIADDLPSDPDAALAELARRAKDSR